VHVRNESGFVVFGTVVMEENEFYLGARRNYETTMRIQYLINYSMYPLHQPINLEALTCHSQSFPYTIMICMTAASIFMFSGMVPVVRRILSLL
jgi:hypothetical protein